jgi:hypothetical protein
MPSVDYSYQLSTTCSGGVNIDALSYEIRASEITKNLYYVYVDNDSDNVIVWFRETLTSPDEDILLYLLQSHKGQPIGMTTTSGVYPDYSKNLLINNEGDGIGVSPVMPFHVTTVTTSAPHDIYGESHIGVLIDSQIPSFITRDSELINASGILNFKIDNLDFYTTDEVDTIVSGLAAWDHDHDLRYIRINNQSVIDHGLISGLNDNDHPQYLLNTNFTIYSGTLQSQIDNRSLLGHIHDDRYYTETELNNGQLNNLYYTEAEVNVISGAINAKIITDHGGLTGLSDDDHSQYHNDTRGDVRYYTKAQTDTISGALNTKITTTSGALQTNINGKSDLGHIHDDRYYTEGEVNTISGTIVAKIITDHGALTGLSDDDHPQYHNDSRGDARYYTQTQLNNGQLDTRYYTETEVNTISGNLQSSINTKLPIAGGTVTGNLTVAGDLVVSGTQFVTNTETVSISDNIIYLNSGELGAGVTKGTAGIQIDRGTLNDYLFVFDEATDLFKVGVSGSLQAVATREDTPTNNYIAYWNDSAKRFDTTSSMLYTDIASKTYVDTVSGVLNTKITTLSGALQTNINGKSDLGHTHDDRYYTETELNNGQLDNRYYTETEVNTISGNITSQLHGRNHGMTSTSDHTAGNNKVFYSNSSGQVVELALSTSGTILMSTGATTAPVFSSLSSLLGPEYADMPAVQVNKTTTTAITTSYADIVWNNQDIENYTDIIEWTSGANITVKETGLYLITYSFPDNNTAGHTLNIRVRKNTTTVLTGSSITYYDSGVQDNMNPTFIASLAANDTLQLQATSNPGATYAAGITFAIVRLRGVKGDVGPAGSGSTVGIQSNSSTVLGSPFGTLNFTNATISGSTTSGIVDITVSSTATPGSPVNSVQFNNAGSFAGDAGMIYSSASDKLTISGVNQTTRLVLGGEDDNTAAAALYIQVDGDSQTEGIRTYFKRSSAGISGWLVYHYDGNTPNLRLIDEDDDPPYIAFQTIGAGTYASPLYDNRFGSRGPVAGATTGFQWIVNGTSISEMDSQFFTPPKGTDGQRPGTPVAGMTRFNTTLGGLECYDGTSWQPQVFGTYFYESSSDTDSSTTSTTWAAKTSITTGTVPAGKYRIGWSYNIYGASTSVSPQARVLLNGTDTIHAYLYEPKDASANEQDGVGGFYYHTLASAGTVTVALQYATETAGSSMTMRRARLEFWRVS